MKQPIPDFMKKYYDGSDEEGKVFLEQMAEQYERERQKYMQNEFVQKTAFQTDWNRVTGSNKQLDPDEAVSHIKEKFEARAKELAGWYGYAEDETVVQDEQQSTDKKPMERQQAKDPSQVEEPKLEGKPSQEQNPLTEREAFLQNLASVREKQDSNETKLAPSETQSGNEESPDQPQATKTQREEFLSNLESMRERQQAHVHRMKH